MLTNFWSSKIFYKITRKKKGASLEAQSNCCPNYSQVEQL